MMYKEIPSVEDARTLADIADRLPWAIMNLFTVVFNRRVEETVNDLETSFNVDFHCGENYHVKHLVDLLIAAGYHVSDIRYHESTKNVEFKVSFAEEIPPIFSTDVAVYQANTAREMLEAEVDRRAWMIIERDGVPRIIEDAKNGERSSWIMMPDKNPLVVNKVIKAFESKGYYVDYTPNTDDPNDAYYLDLRW